MAKVFFTSDIHFGHKNLIHSLRSMTTEESDNLIIKNWNKVVTKRDIVYILGDVTMEKHNIIENYIKQLNGNIIIIGGNHDNRRCCIEYQKLGIPVMGVLEYKGFLCTHIPIHPTQLIGFKGNIHGHIHLSGIFKDTGLYDPPKLEGPYFNVNTEFNNYTPIEFNKIEEYFKNLNYV
jgi:calcineurin-like phosphoesterase family protein